jgi:hypothetical protein
MVESPDIAVFVLGVDERSDKTDSLAMFGMDDPLTVCKGIYAKRLPTI